MALPLQLVSATLLDRQLPHRVLTSQVNSYCIQQPKQSNTVSLPYVFMYHYPHILPWYHKVCQCSLTGELGIEVRGCQKCLPLFSREDPHLITMLKSRCTSTKLIMNLSQLIASVANCIPASLITCNARTCDPHRVSGIYIYKLAHALNLSPRASCGQLNDIGRGWASC